AEPRQSGALAAAERDVKHAGARQVIDRALPLREPPLVRCALRRRAGVTALAAGAALVRELEVRFEWRRQHVLAELALGLAPRGGLGMDTHDALRHHAIDEHERARNRQLDDRAEPLEPGAARRKCTRRLHAIAQRERSVDE